MEHRIEASDRSCVLRRLGLKLGLVGDRDRRPLTRLACIRAVYHGLSKCRKQFSLFRAWLRRDGPPGVSAFPSRGVQGTLSEQWHFHGVSCPLAATFSEHIEFFSVVL